MWGSNEEDQPFYYSCMSAFGGVWVTVSRMSIKRYVAVATMKTWEPRYRTQRSNSSEREGAKSAGRYRFIQRLFRALDWRAKMSVVLSLLRTLHQLRAVSKCQGFFLRAYKDQLMSHTLFFLNVGLDNRRFNSVISTGGICSAIFRYIAEFLGMP